MSFFSFFKKNNEFEELFDEGINLFNNYEYDDALKIFIYLFNNDFINIMLLNYISDSYLKLKHFDDALNYVNKALMLYPKQKYNLINKGVILYYKCCYDDALVIFNEYLQYDNLNYDAILGKLNVLIKLEKVDEAVDFYKSININTDDSEILNKFSVVLLKLNCFDDALYFVNKSLNSDSSNINSWINKGIILTQLEEYDDALYCYNKVLKIDSLNLTSLVNKGIIYKKLKQYDKSIQCYDKCLKINNFYVNAWVNKAITLNIMGENELSISCIDKAIEINNNDFYLLNTKSLLLNNMGLFNESLIYINKALDINPNDINILLNKAEILCNLCRFDEALKTVDIAFKLDNNQDIALVKVKILNELGRIQEAEILEKKSKNLSKKKKGIFIYNK